MRQRVSRPSLLVAGATALALMVPVAPGLAQDRAQDQEPTEAPTQAPGLRASVAPESADVAAGEAVAVTGIVRDGDQVVGQGRVRAVLVDPAGQVLAETEAVVNPNGTYEVAFPASATRDLELGDAFQKVLAARVTVIEADGSEGATTASAVAVSAAPTTLLLENNFTSSVGWVQPGEEYPFRLVVRNLRSQAGQDARVTVAAVDGMSFVSATPVGGAGSASIRDDGSLVWDLGTVPAGSVDAPTERTLVVTARAHTLAQDEQVVWKNLSTQARLTSDTGRVTADSHGPKVIPPNGTYETARYGDRPFPVVPVNYADLDYLDRNSGGDLDEVINDPAFAGSTFNLFQEMSYGQLFPQGDIPSSDIATATWDGFEFGDFHDRDVPAPDADSCLGDYYEGEAAVETALPERIVDGVYSLPGDVEFYGSDSGATGDATVDADGNIDDACGDIGKAVYDAAAIADPEIDYNQYDTDKDGVVDFFMMVFAGCGGNGPSQRDCFTTGGPGGVATDYTTGDGHYDNIWPHSSTLEGGFVDDATGLPGYISDDRLTNLSGELLWHTDATRTKTTTVETAYPAYVRVGPYNVNPEDSLDAASVISHEYGHSLGLPDYYSLSPYGTEYYGTWNLMASDYSQHMDLNGRQELGWVVPKEIPAGDSQASLVDSTIDTNEIQWQTPDGEPYTLAGPDVHNGDAWVAPLPKRILLDPALVENGASPTQVWWSQSGNDFGCVPAPTAHSLDIPLSALEDVPAGTPVELRFNTYFDIEWDFDYGFVLATTDDGQSYASIPNGQGYTIPSDNPYGVACQEKFGNGLTGTSGSYEPGGDPAGDRASGTQAEGTAFLPTTWDLSAYAGQDTTIRFAYNTDVGLARPGWFIDDVEVVAGGDVIYTNDFEDGPKAGVVNGGCDGDIESGPCSVGWQYVAGGEKTTADHAYYIEARDRTGFDFDSRGQSDRGDIDWTPGISLGYTDEARGYGNTQAQDRPNQHVLDDEPVPFDIAAYDPSDPSTYEPSFDPDLSDAAWTPDSPTYSDFGDGHTDNYLDFESADFTWTLAFDCFEMDVLSMTGEDVGPSIPPGNLQADVAFTVGDGCGQRDYGFGNLENARPTAVAQTKDTTVRQGVPVRFDASGSADDVTPRGELSFAWDLDGDGTTDATGETVMYTYEELGEYEAVLTVTDEGGETGTDTLMITVTDDKDVARRIAGGDRVETAIELSRQAFPDGADVAIIGQSQDYPDALAASTLAAEIGAPTLLNPPADLDPRVVAELQRLGVTEVVIVGGPVALSEEVERDLEVLGLDVERIGGGDRIDTAALIGDEVVERGGSVDTAVIARSQDFADALAAGNLGTTQRAPILLTEQAELSPATLAALRRLDPARVVVAGGPVAIPAHIVGQLEGAGFTVERIGGDTRVHTALMLAEEAQDNGAGIQPVVLANAYNYPDALAAGPAAHAMGGVLVTVDPAGSGAELNEIVFDFLSRDPDTLDTVFIAGGPIAIDRSLDAAALAAITTEAEADASRAPQITPVR